MAQIAAGTAVGGEERVSPVARNAIVAAVIGWAVDFYDIYLPAGALTPALVFFVPESVPATIRGTILGVVLVVTLIGRPIGAFIFGHFGDVIGRKQTTMIAVAGFALMTLLIAVMPGYASWGYAAVVILIILRLVDGIFMGGEYTSANPLAMEYTPRRLRGLVGGAIQSSYPLAAIFIFLITSLVFTIAPLKGGASSPYVQWGWRIPFFIGSGLGWAFLVYYWKTVQESRLWQAAAQRTRIKAPLKVLFTGQNLKTLAQVFVTLSGLWFLSQISVTYLSPFLITVLKLPAVEVTLALLFGNIALIIGYMIFAPLGQRFGRRPLFIVGGLWSLVLGPILYFLLARNSLAKGPLTLTLILATLALLLTISPWSQATTYINERFPTGIRASGYGIGYSLAVIIPSFFNFYLLGLAKLMPYAYTPMVLVFVGGLLVTIGAWLGPETKDVEFTPT
jgi:MFS family permease